MTSHFSDTGTSNARLAKCPYHQISWCTTKHIVTEQWLHACNELNHLVPTSEYMVAYADASIRNGECLRASGKYLLSGKYVHHVMGTNGMKFNKPSLEELKDLVEVSGGTWVSTQRKAGNSHAPDVLILMDDNDFDKPKQTRYIQTLLEKGAKKIRWSDLKNCLLAQSLESIFGANTQSAETKQEPKKKTRAQIFKATLNSLLTPPQMKRTPTNDVEAPLGEEVANEEAASLVKEEEVTTPNADAQEASHSTIPDQKKLGGRDEAILLYSTELKFLHRNLSYSGGDRSRGQIGPGIMHITKSNNTGLIGVQVFNKNGLKFQAEVHPNFSGLFGNAGRENILGWDAYDTSGNIISKGTKKSNTENANEAHVRRFYFHFDSREHLTCVLFALFGGDDNARRLVEEFFDGNGRFCPQEEPELPHRVLDPNRMDIDSINGFSPAQPIAPTSRVLFENDPQELSQLF